MAGITPDFPAFLTVLATANPLTPFWLGINVILDVLIGATMFFGLVYLIPRWKNYALTKLNRLKAEAATRRENVAFYNALPHAKLYYYPFWKQMENMYAAGLWITFAFITLMVWFGVLAVGMVLVLSKANVSPLSWNGLVYDLIFARANAQPNGAHVVSYLMLPIVALVVGYNFIPKNIGVLKVVGDIYQGIAITGCFAALHEGLWEIFYYSVYWPYLTWNELTNVLRDVSFTVWIAFMFLAFWKYPNRTIPMKTLKWPVIIYSAYLIGWTFIPYALGYGLFPITTINNPSHSTGLYQETPFWGVWWVEGTEVGSWILLGVCIILAVWAFKRKQT